MADTLIAISIAVGVTGGFWLLNHWIGGPAEKRLEPDWLYWVGLCLLEIIPASVIVVLYRLYRIQF